MAEKVRWGRDGFHFQVNDPFELASLIVRLAADVDVWERLQKSISAAAFRRGSDGAPS